MILNISGRRVGEGQPCFIIAEAGVNHNGDLDIARCLIDEAKKAGADAIKFQTFKAEKIATKDAKTAAYQAETTGASSQFEMIKKLELAEDEFRQLKAYADELDIIFMSTPFDEASADILAAMDMPAYKIASGEITNFPLLRHIAKKGKPVILSTGMATMDEIHHAVDVIREAGLNKIAVLHCVTSYPAEMHDLNLRSMETMRNELELPTGYSDHSLGIAAPIAAVALGASIIEKHFTLDRDMEGPDHRASLEPWELAEMVNSIRDIEKALGHGRKVPTTSELEIRDKVRKSIVAAVDIPKGTTIMKEMLAVKRPGTGLHPKHIEYLIGKTAARNIAADEMLAMEDFA